MKRILMTILLSVTILFVLNGCGKKKGKEETTQLTAPSAAAIQQRKQAFDHYIHGFTTYGLDVNRTQDSDTQSLYLLTVKDAQKAAQSLLNVLNINTLDMEDRTTIANMIEDAQIGIEADWKKYAQNAPESLFVYYMGNGREERFGKQLVEGKKIGAYLTYDASNHLKKARIKDLNDTFTEGNTTVHTLLKGAHIDFLHHATENNMTQVYDLFGGYFSLDTTDTATHQTLHVDYKDPNCHVVRDNFYLGNTTCTLPLMTLLNEQDSLKMAFALNQTQLKYVTSEHTKKVRTDITLSIADIDGQIADRYDGNGSLRFKTFKIDGYTDNVDTELVKAFYNLSNNLPKDQNASLAKSMELVSRLYENGLIFAYGASIDTVEGKGKGMTFVLRDYSGNGNGSFDENITYTEKSQVAHVSLRDLDHNQTLFDLENFTIGYGVKGLYNFLPALMQLSAKVAEQTDKNATLSVDMEKQLTQMGERFVHHGFELFLAPVGFDALHINGNGKAADLGKLHLDISAKLLPNTMPVNMNNPLAALMLLPYLQADGKLVLPKKDLDSLAKSLPPQMVMMLIMFAKYEGDNAILELKFENGHLLINGQPMM